MVKVVGFDLDNTLYYQSSFEFQLFEEIVEILKKESLIIDKQKYFESMKYFYEKKDFYKLFDKAYIRSFKTLPKTWEQEYIPIILNIYRNFKPKNKLKVNSSTFKLLNFLHKSPKYKTILITDGKSKMQNTKIDLLGIRNMFDLIFISDDFNPSYRKPNTFMFKKTLEYFNIFGAQMVYIGDDEGKDKSCEKEGIRYISVDKIYKIYRLLKDEINE